MWNKKNRKRPEKGINWFRRIENSLLLLLHIGIDTGTYTGTYTDTVINTGTDLELEQGYCQCFPWVDKSENWGFVKTSIKTGFDLHRERNVGLVKEKVRIHRPVYLSRIRGILYVYPLSLLIPRLFQGTVADLVFFCCDDFLQGFRNLNEPIPSIAEHWTLIYLGF